MLVTFTSIVAEQFPVTPAQLSATEGKVIEAVGSSAGVWMSVLLLLEKVTRVTDAGA